MDEQLKSRFEHVLQQYADVIKERDAAQLREKMDREQFEASFRAAVDNVILSCRHSGEGASNADKLGLPRHQIRQWPLGESRDLPGQHEGHHRRTTAFQNLSCRESQRRADFRGQPTFGRLETKYCEGRGHH